MEAYGNACFLLTLLTLHVLYRENKLKGNFQGKNLEVTNLEVTNLGEEKSKNCMYSQQTWPNQPAIS